MYTAVSGCEAFNRSRNQTPATNIVGNGPSNEYVRRDKQKRLGTIRSLLLSVLVHVSSTAKSRKGSSNRFRMQQHRVTAMASACGRRTNGRAYRRWQPIGGPVDLPCVPLGGSTRPYIYTGTVVPVCFLFAVLYTCIRSSTWH